MTLNRLLGAALLLIALQGWTGMKSLPYGVPPDEQEVFSFGDNRVNFRTYEATTADRTVRLTEKECMLMKLLVERQAGRLRDLQLANPGRVFDMADLVVRHECFLSS